MNFETLEYLTDKFSELYDFYEDDQVQAVKKLDGWWQPSSFSFLSDTLLEAIIEGYINFADEEVEKRVGLKIHIEDGLEDVKECIQYLLDNSETGFERYFWSRQLG